MLKWLGFWLPNQNYFKYLVTRMSGSPPCFSPADHCDSTPWLENRPNERQFSWSRGWADCPLNAATESCCPRSWKIAGVAGTLLNTRCVDCRRNNITTTFQPHTMTVGWVEHSSSVHKTLPCTDLPNITTILRDQIGR